MPNERDTKLLHNRLEILTAKIEKKKLELEKFEVARELLMHSDDDDASGDPMTSSATVTVECPQGIQSNPALIDAANGDQKSDTKSPPVSPKGSPNDVGNMSLRHFIK
jgi:hypothetical protein